MSREIVASHTADVSLAIELGYGNVRTALRTVPGFRWLVTTSFSGALDTIHPDDARGWPEWRKHATRANQPSFAMGVSHGMGPDRKSPKNEGLQGNDLPGNRILDALPEDERHRLLNLMERESVEIKQPLMEPGQEIRNVYFPLTSVASFLTLMDDGAGVEIATVGNEGMVGAPVFLGTSSLSDRDLAQVQVPGEVLRCDVASFREEAANGRVFRAVVQRYVQDYLRQVSQQVACNGLHNIEERCSRWILLTHDRVGEQEFPLTQEFLSQMLGVRRASVTVAVGSLQQAGFLRFDRGRVRILDRSGLEAASCECYRIIRQEFDRQMPGDGDRP